MDEYDRLYKVVIIGDSNVGKSSLLQRYCDDEFTEGYVSTIGVDFRIKTVQYEGLDIKLQIWDTAGQERFRSIVKSYYRGAHAVVVCFDLSDVKTFINVNNWLEEFEREYSGSGAKLLLVGTKGDLTPHKVTGNDISSMCQQRGMCYVETSAKTGKGCEAVFTSLMDQLRLATNIPYNKPQHRSWTATHTVAETGSRCC